MLSQNNHSAAFFRCSKTFVGNLPMVAELKNDFFQKNLNFSNMEYPSKTKFSGLRDMMIEKLSFSS